MTSLSGILLHTAWGPREPRFSRPRPPSRRQQHPVTGRGVQRLHPPCLRWDIPEGPGQLPGSQECAETALPLQHGPDSPSAPHASCLQADPPSFSIVSLGVSFPGNDPAYGQLWRCHLLTQQLPLAPCFLICKMGITVIPTSRACHTDKTRRVNTGKALRTGSGT